MLRDLPHIACGTAHASRTADARIRAQQKLQRGARRSDHPSALSPGPAREMLVGRRGPPFKVQAQVTHPLGTPRKDAGLGRTP